MIPGEISEDLLLGGVPVSPGIAIGKVFRFRQIDLGAVGSMPLPVQDVRAELRKLAGAMRASKKQLAQLKTRSREKSALDVANIFEAQELLLESKDVMRDIERAVVEQKFNVEYALARATTDLERNFAILQDPLISARILDVQDVYYRLLRNILNIEHVRVTPLTRIGASVVLLAEKLLPSDVAILDMKNIEGIVIEEGSAVSHVAIIAKSLGIPTVMSVPGVVSVARPDTPIIVDGGEGLVILRPSSARLDSYRKAQRKEHAHARTTASPRRCATTDGVAVQLEANAGSLNEVKEALRCGAAGIGLLRSEIFHIAASAQPSIEAEQQFYEKILRRCGDRPVTIRLLDIGADKSPLYLNTPLEENPQLGVRGIRFLLALPELLRAHATSVIRASTLRPVRILLPFVASVNDVEMAREAVDTVCAKEGITKRQFTLGMMVETPAAVLSLPSFMPLVDFFGIGTNDLVQYLYAADRENEKVGHYRASSLDLIVRIVKYIVDNAGRHGKEVSVCGEMAANPRAAALFVGVGVRNLSMQPASLQAVRQEIESASCAELVAKANEFLGSSSGYVSLQ